MSDPSNRTGRPSPPTGASPTRSSPGGSANGGQPSGTASGGILSGSFADLIRRLEALPSQLSPRERMLVGALAGVLILAAVFGLWRGLSSYQRDLAERLKSTQDSIAELRQLGPATVRTTGSASRPLPTILEELLTRTGLRDRVQLNPVTQEGAGRPQAMEIKAEQLTLDETVRLVYAVEGPDAPVAVDQFEIAPSFRDKELLRVSLRVVGRS